MLGLKMKITTPFGKRFCIKCHIQIFWYLRVLHTWWADFAHDKSDIQICAIPTLWSFVRWSVISFIFTWARYAPNRGTFTFIIKSIMTIAFYPCDFLIELAHKILATGFLYFSKGAITSIWVQIFQFQMSLCMSSIRARFEFKLRKHIKY